MKLKLRPNRGSAECNFCRFLQRCCISGRSVSDVVLYLKQDLRQISDITTTDIPQCFPSYLNLVGRVARRLCLGVPKFGDTVDHMPGINDDLPISRSRMRVAHTPSQLLNHAGSSWILGVSDDANRLYKGATADPAPPLCRGGVPPTNRRQCPRLHCQAD